MILTVNENSWTYGYIRNPTIYSDKLLSGIFNQK